MKPLVSVIIPVYNRAIFLDEAVESVRTQTFSNWELILVDDGSTDDTQGRVLEIVASDPERIHGIRIENGGPGLARESARQIAGGRYIQYLDSDDVLLPEKLALQVNALEQNPDRDVAYGMIQLINEQGDVLEEDHKWGGRSFEALLPALLVSRWWSTHTPLWRRSFLNTVGPWSSLRMGEDWEYEARAARCGARLFHLPVPLSQTRRHQEARLTGVSRITNEHLTGWPILLQSLSDAAAQCAISPDSVEMKHFCRWAFSLSRQAGGRGLPKVAAVYWGIARGVVVPGSKTDRELLCFGYLCKVLGWRLPSTGLEWAHRRIRRTPGAETLLDADAQVVGKR